MNTVLKQALENLPQELLALPRFLATRKDNPKAPKSARWQDPKNQKLCSELQGVRGFVASTETEESLLFLDFDHVLDDDGNFISATAEKWFKDLHQDGTYCERSQSGHGLHIFTAPSKGKFDKLTGKIFFNEDKTSFLEIFYRTTKFCLATGNLFRCAPNAPIAKGAQADNMLTKIVDELKKPEIPQEKTAQGQPRNTQKPAHATTNPDYDAFRVEKMLRCVPVSDLSGTEWLCVMSVLKNLEYDYGTVERLNQGGAHYNADENRTRWDSLNDPNFDIETLHGIAKRFGYSESDSRREWHDLHPETCADNLIRTREKIKGCPANLIIPESFTFGSNGIDFIVPPKKETDNPKHVCVTRNPITPTKKFREPEKGDVEYEIAIFVDGSWSTTEISGATLADNKELAKTLSGKGALILEPKYLGRFFADIIALNSGLPKLKSYNQTGWTSEDFDNFAYPSDSGNCVVRRQGFNFDKVFKPKGNPDDWKDNFLKITEQGGAQARCIMGAAAASFLIRPLGLMNLQVHLWGARSLGKTPLERFAVSAFGDSRVGGLTYTFSASPKSRLETAAAFRDCPIIGEELESLGKREAEQLPQDVYNFSLGISGQALKKDGTLRDPKLFNNTRLTSGEHELTKSSGNGGELKRVLQLRASKLLEENFAADLHGFCDHNHGLFLHSWIEYIIKNRDKIIREYHASLKICKKQYPNTDATQIATLTASLVAFQHFKICIGLQNNANPAEFCADCKTIIATMPRSEDIDDTARAVEFLGEFVGGHEKYFPTLNDNNEIIVAGFTHETYGIKLSDTEYAIIPSVLRKILEEQGGFTSGSKLVAEFCDKQLLITNSGRRDHALGNPVRKYIHFKPGILARDAEDVEEEYYRNLGVM